MQAVVIEHPEDITRPLIGPRENQRLLQVVQVCAVVLAGLVLNKPESGIDQSSEFIAIPLHLCAGDASRSEAEQVKRLLGGRSSCTSVRSVLGTIETSNRYGQADIAKGVVRDLRRRRLFGDRDSVPIEEGHKADNVTSPPASHVETIAGKLVS